MEKVEKKSSKSSGANKNEIYSKVVEAWQTGLKKCLPVENNKNGNDENNSEGQGSTGRILEYRGRGTKPNKKSVERNREEHEIKEHDFINGFLDKFKDKVKPQNTFLINMELRNGMHSTFMISTNKNYFQYQKASYVIDSDLKYYHVGSKCFMLDYHQDFCMPIKRVIPVSDVNKAIKSSQISEIENATNPMTLQNFITSKVAEGVMKGQALVEEFKIIKILLILGVAASIIHLLLFVFKSGMLDSVQGLI